MGFFFCFKRKTAYERRISDWSSDVCSSDLLALVPEDPADLRWEAGDVAEIGPRPVGGAQADGAPLPSREYSIASVPGDGSLQLLVRRMFHSDGRPGLGSGWLVRSEEHTSELQSLMRISYAVFCLKKKN